eukprot:2807434-Pleurochrysis_carterae.AAC.2
MPIILSLTSFWSSPQTLGALQVVRDQGAGEQHDTGDGTARWAGMERSSENRSERGCTNSRRRLKQRAGKRDTIRLLSVRRDDLGVDERL